MKFTLAIAAIAGAAAVSAQSISDLPKCATNCYIQGAEGSGCSDIADLNCQCQAATQAIIAGISGPCLMKACTNPADIASAASVGSAICATIPQTALASVSAASSSAATSSAAPASASATSTSTATVTSTSTSVLATSSAMAASSELASSSAMPASSSAVAVISSSTIAVTTAAAASSTAVVPVTQITDGQPQATTATVAPYTGAAAAFATAGVEALLVAAGAAVFAL